MTSPNDTFAVLAPNLVVSGNLVSEGIFILTALLRAMSRLCILRLAHQVLSKAVYSVER